MATFEELLKLDSLSPVSSLKKSETVAHEDKGEKQCFAALPRRALNLNRLVAIRVLQCASHHHHRRHPDLLPVTHNPAHPVNSGW